MQVKVTVPEKVNGLAGINFRNPIPNWGLRVFIWICFPVQVIAGSVIRLSDDVDVATLSSTQSSTQTP